MALVSYALSKLRAVCQESYRTRSKLVLFWAKSPTLVVMSDSDCKPLFGDAPSPLSHWTASSVWTECSSRGLPEVPPSSHSSSQSEKEKMDSNIHFPLHSPLISHHSFSSSIWATECLHAGANSIKDTQPQIHITIVDFMFYSLSQALG